MSSSKRKANFPIKIRFKRQIAANPPFEAIQPHKGYKSVTNLHQVFSTNVNEAFSSNVEISLILMKCGSKEQIYESPLKCRSKEQIYDSALKKFRRNFEIS